MARRLRAQRARPADVRLVLYVTSDLIHYEGPKASRGREGPRGAHTALVSLSINQY